MSCPVTAMERRTVLLVEDDESIRTMLRLALEDEGLRVVEASDGEAALLEFSRHAVDLVLLDIRLPGMSGIDVCRELRRRGTTPLVGLTAQWSATDATAGFDAGLDDYLLKPIRVDDLVRRMEGLLTARAEPATAPSTVCLRELEVTLPAGTANVGGRELPLTRIEGQLLAILVERPGLLIHREELLERVWSADAAVDPRLVDLHMDRLAAKLHALQEDVPVLTRLAGIGYKLMW